MLLAPAHRGLRPGKPPLQRMARTVDYARTGPGPLALPSEDERALRSAAERDWPGPGMDGGGEDRSIPVRADLFLGRFRFCCERHAASALVSHARDSTGDVRIHFRDGTAELLPRSRPFIFLHCDFVARRGMGESRSGSAGGALRDGASVRADLADLCDRLYRCSRSACRCDTSSFWFSPRRARSSSFITTSGTTLFTKRSRTHSTGSPAPISFFCMEKDIVIPERLLIGFAAVALIVDVVRRRREPGSGRRMRLPLQLYVVAELAVFLFPRGVHFPHHVAIALITERLTSISAAAGCCLLGVMQPRRWHLAASARDCRDIFCVPLPGHRDD